MPGKPAKIEHQHSDDCRHVCPADAIGEKINVLSATLAVHASKLEEATERLDELIEKVTKTLFGNGTPGVIIRLDRMEQAHELRTKREERLGKFIAALLLGVGVQALLGIGAFVWVLIRLALNHGALQ